MTMYIYRVFIARTLLVNFYSVKISSKKSAVRNLLLRLNKQV